MANMNRVKKVNCFSAKEIGKFLGSTKELELRSDEK